MIIDTVYGGMDDLSKGCLYQVLGWRPICWSASFGPWVSDLKISSLWIFILAKRILIDSQKNTIFYWFIFIHHHQRLAKKKIGNWPNQCSSWLLKSPSERVSPLVSSIYVSFGHFSMNLTIKTCNLAKDKKLASKLGVFEIGSIYCYYRGHKIEFAGQRSTDILVEFILELDEHPVEDINSKVEVTAFKRKDS